MGGGGGGGSSEKGATSAGTQQEANPWEGNTVEPGLSPITPPGNAQTGPSCSNILEKPQLSCRDHPLLQLPNMQTPWGQWKRSPVPLCLARISLSHGESMSGCESQLCDPREAA